MLHDPSCTLCLIDFTFNFRLYWAIGILIVSFFFGQMGQHKRTKGHKGKFSVNTDFGSARVSIRESTPGCSPMVSL